MIRYIAVTESPDQDESMASHIPESQIERIDRDTSGKAILIVREYREKAREDSECYGRKEWRIDGYESQERYSVMKFDDLIAWLNGLPPEPLILDLSKAEQDKIRRTLNSTQQTLDSIQYDGGPVRTVNRSHIGIESDVLALIRLLKDREYAEHWATSALGKDLEEEITKLVGHDNAAASRLQRAETLLRQVHELVTDGGMYPSEDEKTLTAIGDFLRK